MKSLVAVCVVVCALLVAASSSAAAQCAGGPGCPDKCEYDPGYGYRCAAGTAGCYCGDQNGVCWYVGCDKTEEEEDEEAVVTARQTGSVHLLNVAGEVFVAVDPCLRRTPLVLRFSSGAGIEIVRPAARAGGD
ncbi:MAG: hypothetical protein AAB409_04740 [Gemmatimonadota bacterium]